MNDTWTPLAEGQPVLHYAPGQFIYLQDTQADRFYYIVSGTVKCFLSAESGEERTPTLLRAGELIGEAAFFDKQPRVSSAVAVTKCELVEVDHARLAQVFRLHPELASAMLENLARRVRATLGTGLAEARYRQVPPPPAVNESVKLVRAFGKSSAAGLANAVLRKACAYDLDTAVFADGVERLMVLGSGGRGGAAFLRQ